ncbi:porin [Variovorax sp. MHTC-1]|uniref:porin n=1 Tax=Variovorax sp. MHTC-1 TaxID=2495593 RepID=UPI000F8856B5|nr:porin [Variovorax sp. MHTC-1]RST55849.1 porin [Variovorax sp. MHTC-1]
MKKILAAIAALATAGWAAAQSSVTLFGVVDAGVSYQSATSRDVTTGLSSKQSKWSLANSGYNSSRIGFRGTEDLGGGLAASFWLESPITNDDGATGIATFNRRSTVSLSGGFGELRLGRDYTPTFWNDTVFDPFGTNGSGTNVISSVSASSGLANANYTRASNSIGYFLPPNLGGFYGQIQYSLHENADSSTAVDTASTNSNAGRYVGGRFGWANGPWDVAVSLGENIAIDTTELTRKVRTANLGASYDFGSVKLFGELSSVRNGFESALAATHDSYNGYLLGATVPVGPGLIRASYSEVRYNEGAQGLVGEDPRVRKLALGYVHNLSKRTALYATVARVNNRNDAAYAGSLSSAITTGYGSSGVSYTGLPRSSTGYDFGIRHAF